MNAKKGNKDTSSLDEESVVVKSLKRNNSRQTKPISNRTKKSDKNAKKEMSTKKGKHKNKVKRKKLI